MNLLEPTRETGGTTRSVLGFLQQQLEAEEVPLTEVLGGLARAFAVEGAGLGVLLEEPAPHHAAPAKLAMWEAHWNGLSPEFLPWDSDDMLLARIKDASAPVALQSAGSDWLCAAVRQGSASWVVWLADRQHLWTAADKSCLNLAAECVVQRFLAGPEGSGWLSRKRRLHLQEGINRTAAVTRRLTHDFCNILTSISGFAELALLKMPGDSPARRFIGEVLESARQGARWSQRLQLFCQDRQQPFLPTSLVALLAEEQVRPDWHHEIALKVDVPPMLPSVAVEGESLRVAVRAVLDNAREAMDGHGTVSVTARPVHLGAAECLEMLGKPHPGTHVELTIRDTGTGLSDDVRQRLFRDLFFTSKGRRRGLGLAAVCGILQTYHGGFRIDCPPDRSGTIVTLFLPAENSPCNR